MTTKTKKAAKGIITDWVQYSVLIVLQLILMPLILNLAGSDILGAYSIIMQVIGYGLILDFGISVALNRYLSQTFRSNQNSTKFEKIFDVGRVFVLAINFFLFLFIIILAKNIEVLMIADPAIQEQSRICLFMFAFWTLLRSPLILYGNALIASQNMSIANNISLLSGLSRILVSIILIYLDFGLIGLVFANIFSELCGLLLKRYYFTQVCSEIDLRWRLPNAKLLSEVFKFGVTYWGVNIAIVLTSGSDSIVVGHLYGATAAGIFYTTKIPTFLVIQAIFKISDNSAPAINELQSAGKLEAIRSAYLKILRYSLILAVPMAIGVVSFNEGVVSAWVGKDQYAGNIMSLALALYVLTQVINHVNAIITVSAGRMKHWITISVATGVITILLAYFLARSYGFQWVMVSIAVMEVPTAVFLIYRSFNCMALDYGSVVRRVIFPVTLVAIPLTIWTYLTFLLGLYDAFSGLAFCIVIYILIWAFSSFIFGMDCIERAFLKEKIAFLNQWKF